METFSSSANKENHLVTVKYFLFQLQEVFKKLKQHFRKKNKLKTVYIFLLAPINTTCFRLSWK
jgi:hypothetical protein